MKWTSLSLALLGLSCAVARADDVTFTQGLSLDEMHRAGLDKLTADERAALDQLVAGRKTLVKEVVRTVTVETAADPTPQAVAQRATATTSAADAGGWLHWTHSAPSPTPGDKSKPKKADKDTPPELAITSTLVGKFKGWGKNTVFHLANGQAWVVSDYSERQFVEAVDNPTVVVSPASVFGFVLTMPDNEDVYIRVRPAN